MGNSSSSNRSHSVSTNVDDAHDVQLSTDQLIDTLRRSPRRAILRYLADVDGAVSVTEVIDVVTDHESSRLSRSDVALGVRHVHIPKLDDVGVVEYDTNRRTVELKECAAPLFPHLELIDERTSK